MARAASVLAAALLPTCALGHGYVQTPASRGWGCMRDNGQLRNTNCGQVQWEAWSVEGLDGTPRYPAQAANGIPDGRLASANRPRDRWAQLDEQSATRWDKVQLSSGWTEFRWKFVAPHATRDFRYFISKVDWNPEAPLTRATFEDEPFCTVELQGALADTNPNHMCNVPPRRGYHVVFAVWDVSDTANSFYNVIDAIVDGPVVPGTPSPQRTPVPLTPPPATPVPRTQPPRTPVPRTQPPATPTPQGGRTCQRWEECTRDAGCCVRGTECVVVNQWYSQCKPSSTVPTPPAGCSSAVEQWGDCTRQRGCCVSGTRCVELNQWYAQCRPL